MIRPMDVTPEVIDALHSVRTWARLNSDVRPYLEHAIQVLEETGVFAEIDEAADEDAALYTLAGSAALALAEAQGGRDYELHDPLSYLRAVNDAQTGA